MTFYKFIYSLLIILINYNCNNNIENKDSIKNIENEKILDYRIKKIHYHNNNFFTQGLYIDNNKIYEGTGSPGNYKSGIFVYDLDDTKTIKQKKILDSKYFGEGLTIFKDKIYQLTWQNHECFVYDKKTLNKIKSFKFNTEGWGITNNESTLIISDGSSKLYFYDPNTFELIEKITVTGNEGEIDNLNELEYIEGYIFANRWMSNLIYIINPKTGIVENKIDFTNLISQYKNEIINNTDAVLNGIAYLKDKKHILITGKLWPFMFEIELIPLKN